LIEIILAAIGFVEAHHWGALAALVLTAYLDLSLRLRFLEWVIRRRKVLSIGPLTLRERWLPWTSLAKWVRRHKTIAIENGRGPVSESNVDTVIERRRKHERSDRRD
jgi:hypothetical protein